MSTNDRMEHLLIELLAEESPSRTPDRLVPETLRALRHVRRWPRWYALMKEPPMRYSSRVAVGSPTLRLITMAAVGLLLLLVTSAAIVAGARVLASDAVVSPYGPASNGTIVYDRDGDIYLLEPDGRTERALFTGPSVDVGPFFSHDGTTIAFARESDETATLMLADADGGEPREIVDGIAWIEFTPSDAEAVILRLVDDRDVLSVVDLGSGEMRDLDLDGIEPYYWAYPRPPDGAEIIFAGFPTPGEDVLRLYAIGIDGTGLRAIGEPITPETPTGDRILSVWEFQDPSISPDGTMIAYWNWRADDESVTDLGPFIHMRDLTTGEDLPVPFSTVDTRGSVPRFTPDGDHIVFQGTLDPNVNGYERQLRYGWVDGREPSIPVGPVFNLDRSLNGWEISPDGTQVVLSLRASGASSFIDLATGETTAITDISYLGQQPSWQRLAP